MATADTAGMAARACAALAYGHWIGDHVSLAPAAALTDTLIGSPPATASAEPGTCTAPDPPTLRRLYEAGRTPVTAPTSLGTARPTGASLRALAKSTTIGACDTRGRYDYMQLRQWVTDTRAAGGRSTLTTALLQYEHWLAADGSGRAIAALGVRRYWCRVLAVLARSEGIGFIEGDEEKVRLTCKDLSV